MSFISFFFLLTALVYIDQDCFKFMVVSMIRLVFQVIEFLRAVLCIITFCKCNWKGATINCLRVFGGFVILLVPLEKQNSLLSISFSFIYTFYL